MKRIKKWLPPKISLAVSLVALVFLVMLLSILSAGLIAYLLSEIGILDLKTASNPSRAIFIMVYISIFLGVANCCIIKSAFCQTYSRYDESY